MDKKYHRKIYGNKFMEKKYHRKIYGKKFMEKNPIDILQNLRKYSNITSSGVKCPAEARNNEN